MQISIAELCSAPTGGFPAPGPSSAETVSFCFLLSELLWDASLLQYRIGCVAGQNFVVDGKAALRDWAVPDFVIPATGAFKSAPVSTKNFL
jgi:hypothetical protein